MILMAEIGSNTDVKMSLFVDDENVRYVRYIFNMDNHDVLDLDELKFLKYFGSAHPTTLRDNYGVVKMSVVMAVPFMESLQKLHENIGKNSQEDYDFGDIETDILHLVNVSFLDEKGDDVTTYNSVNVHYRISIGNYYLSEAKMVHSNSMDEPLLRFKMTDGMDSQSYFFLEYELNYP